MRTTEVGDKSAEPSGYDEPLIRVMTRTKLRLRKARYFFGLRIPVAGRTTHASIPCIRPYGPGASSGCGLHN